MILVQFRIETTISGVYPISKYGLLALFPKYAACLIGKYCIVGYKGLHKATIPCGIALRKIHCSQGVQTSACGRNRYGGGLDKLGNLLVH
jgi:hypothetical protein